MKDDDGDAVDGILLGLLLSLILWALIIGAGWWWLR